MYKRQAEAQRIAYDRGLRNILEPRMVALLEATMWRQIRDPEYLLGALKVYYMMTGLAPYDREFAAQWWQDQLPLNAPIDPFPTDAALEHQLAAIDRMGSEEQKIAPDNALVQQALQSICTIPLAARAYSALITDPAVTALPEWIPAEKAGPNATHVLTRISEKTLRVGLPGAFTYDGFHTTVLPLIPEVAATAALDQAVFAGGCAESSDASVATLEADILKLYQDDPRARAWLRFEAARLAKSVSYHLRQASILGGVINQMEHGDRPALNPPNKRAPLAGAPTEP